MDRKLPNQKSKKNKYQNVTVPNATHWRGNEMNEIEKKKRFEFHASLR